MCDEEIEYARECPYCGSTGSCEHVVACIDQTFAECAGGELHKHRKEFKARIEKTFLRMLNSGANPNFKQPELDELWQITKTDHTPRSSEVDLDDFPFCGLLIDLLEESGATGLSITEDGGPGMSSSCRLLFDENPPRVIERALDLLRRHLETNDADD